MCLRNGYRAMITPMAAQLTRAYCFVFAFMEKVGSTVGFRESGSSVLEEVCPTGSLSTPTETGANGLECLAHNHCALSTSMAAPTAHTHMFPLSSLPLSLSFPLSLSVSLQLYCLS